MGIEQASVNAPYACDLVEERKGLQLPVDSPPGSTLTKSSGCTKFYRNWYSDLPPPSQKKNIYIYQSPVLPKLHLSRTSTHIIACEIEANSVSVH